MPEKEIKARGGAQRWRTISPKPGRYMRVAVVRRPGKRGGRTVAGKLRHTKRGS